MLRLFLTFLAVLASTATADAANRRRTPVRQPQRSVTPQQSLVQTPTTSAAVRSPEPISTVSTATESPDALHEVNEARRQRGLKPFIKDEGLTAGAFNVAQFRAARLIQGHTKNDFQGLPVGVTAAASGCAAWEPWLKWGSCCTYENYRFAGAAWALGRDGKRYMSLFVR